MNQKSDAPNPQLLRSRTPPGPLILLLAPFGLGILAGWYGRFANQTLLLTLPFLIAGLYASYRYKKDIIFSILLILFAFTAGVGRVQITTKPSPESTMRLPDQTVLVAEGHLSSVEQKTKTTPSGKKIPWSKATLEVHQITIRDFTRPASGTLQIYTFRKPAPYAPGARLRVEGMLKKFSSRTNPGSSNWDWYRHQRETGGSLVVQNDEDWRHLPADHRCVKGHLTALRYWVNQQMQSGRFRFQLLPAMVLGMRDHVDRDLETTFQRSGTIHFLAVSGLHVGFLLLGGFLLLRTLRVPPGMSSILLILFVSIYLALTGFRLPTLRASVMIGLLLLGIQARKNIGSIQLLGIAAWILLLHRPLDLFSPGFQFSLLSVTGLVLLSGALGLPDPRNQASPEKRLLREFLWFERFKSYLWNIALYGGSVVTATAVVLLVVGPLILYHFHLVAPGSLLANPVLFITLPLLLGIGFAHMLMAVLSGLGFPLVPWLLPLTGHVLHALESMTIYISSLVTALPGSYLYLPAPHWLFLALYYLLLLSIWWYHRRIPYPQISVWLCGSGCFILLLMSGFLRFSSSIPGASLTMLDVGHGSSFILSDRTNHHIVYDCGSKGYSNPGTWITSPALWRRRTSTIDLLILSHSDLDHISGVRALAYRFSINRIWVSPHFNETPDGRALRKELRALGYRVETVSAGHTKTIGETTLTVESPPTRFDARPKQTHPPPNAASLVVRARTGSRSILFTGDLEGIGKKWFRRRMNTSRFVDIFQVPHHGGAGTAKQPLVEEFDMKYALISASEGHVSPAVRKRYKKPGTRVISTVKSGAVQLRWSDSGSSIIPLHWTGEEWSIMDKMK